MEETKKIIVAPLNWGLGHATRCIPIIVSLLDHGYMPVLASDGEALDLLQKEFQHLETISLPSYDVHYKKRLRLGLLLQFPKIRRAVRQESQIINRYLAKNDVHGIISDNRFGVRSIKVPSVYITHQINVLSGITTFFTSKIHQRILEKFDECWIPDNERTLSLSGKLSDTRNVNIKIKYLGVLSRLKREQKSIKNDILILLSGPEPQRSTLEKLLLAEFQEYPGKVVFVRGKIEETQIETRRGNLLIYNYVLRAELQELMNTSALVICRSGYSSILDLARLEKKAFFIPTPNQSEQEYLAVYLEAQQIAPFAKQEKFGLELLKEVKNYNGFQRSVNSKIQNDLFDLFERKRKS